jgi:hypothetical protein
MYNDHLTREQAIDEVGINVVKAVESENCEPTNRVLNGEDNNIYEEWEAKVWVKEGDLDGIPTFLSAFYFPKKEEFYDEDGFPKDLDDVDWEIEYYTVS